MTGMARPASAPSTPAAGKKLWQPHPIRDAMLVSGRVRSGGRRRTRQEGLQGRQQRRALVAGALRLGRPEIGRQQHPGRAAGGAEDVAAQPAVVAPPRQRSAAAPVAEGAIRHHAAFAGSHAAPTPPACSAAGLQDRMLQEGSAAPPKAEEGKGDLNCWLQAEQAPAWLSGTHVGGSRLRRSPPPPAPAPAPGMNLVHVGSESRPVRHSTPSDPAGRVYGGANEDQGLPTSRDCSRHHFGRGCRMNLAHCKPASLSMHVDSAADVSFASACREAEQARA